MAVYEEAAGGLLAGEKAKLRRVLRRFDLVLFTACAIVGLDTVAFAASAGGQAITWLGISMVVFLVPYGLLTAELGSTFPLEGGPYEWVKMSFGRLPGAITAVLYWLSNPIWIGGTLSATAIATLNSFVFSKPLGTWAEIGFGLAFTWITVLVAIVAFRYGKWAPNIGTIVKMLAVAIFTALFVIYLTRHGHPAAAVGAADLKPTVSGFLTVVGVLVFLWVGFELSNGASEEMLDAQRDVPKMIFSSGVIAALLYGLTIAGTLLVIPKGHLSNVSGFTDAYQAVGGVLGSHSHTFGYIFGILIVLTLFGSGAVWLEGADRTQAITALDGAGPAWMGRFASFGTPIAVNLLSGIIASAFVFFVFLFTSGSLSKFFSTMISLVISTTSISYFFIFPALPILRKRYPDAPRPYRVPGGLVGCWICALVSEAFVVVTAITLLWPGAIDGWLGHSYSIKANWGVSRMFFESTTLSAMGVMILIGVIFWAVGSRSRGLTGKGEETEPPPSPVPASAARSTPR